MIKYQIIWQSKPKRTFGNVCERLIKYVKLWKKERASLTFKKLWESMRKLIKYD